MTEPALDGGASGRFVLIGIALLLVGYAASALFGLPQHGTKLTNATGPHDATAPLDEPAPYEPTPDAPGHVAPSPPEPPPLYMVIPFALLLGCIAVLPLMHATEHWWESNLHRFYVAGGLALVTVAYYAVAHEHAVHRHFLGNAIVARGEGAISWPLAATILQNALLNEYVPFIVLLFALYTISGGVRIEGDLPAHPLTNASFLAIGAVLANLIGTTGAAMLLVRPLLETNSERKHVRHTLVFFIFVVCNCGGCLLPIGDPPLFLGYLQGVDFLWTLSLWKPWLLVNGSLIAIYLAWDHFVCYPKETKADVARDESQVRRLTFSGVWPNALLLLTVVAAIGLLDPTKDFPGTDWKPWLFLREAALLGLVGLSLLLGSNRVRQANRFNYGAILEVAALFLGIFVCMQPALQILAVRGASLGVDTPAKFFWSTGSLSAVLDNAPTYLVFFQAAQSLHSSGAETMAGVPVDMLAAISLGAVFMGAITYIGNGPNFMVKAIAEKSGVQMPSFFGYMGYSCAVLVPLFVVVTLVFFRD
jgi:Na+/H+ antiporter NhaD/arsenite permease-like protein